MDRLKRSYETYAKKIKDFLVSSSEQDIRVVKEITFSKYVALLSILDELSEIEEVIHISQKKLALLYKIKTGYLCSQGLISQMLISLENEGNLVKKLGPAKYVLLSNRIEDYSRYVYLDKYIARIKADSSFYDLDYKEQSEELGIRVKDLERLKGYITYLDVIRYIDSI